MYLKPSEIRFSQDSINNYFDQRSAHSFKRIGDTLDDICEGRCSIHQIPTISVVNENGNWITADNRRLWVFRELERLGKCDEIPVNRGYYIPASKRTSYNDGKSIHVRRDPGGRWHNKPTFSKPLNTEKENVPNEYSTRTIHLQNIENLPRKIQPKEMSVGSHAITEPTRYLKPSRPQDYSITQENYNDIGKRPVVNSNTAAGVNDIEKDVVSTNKMSIAKFELERNTNDQSFVKLSSNDDTSKVAIRTPPGSYGFANRSAITSPESIDLRIKSARTTTDDYIVPIESNRIHEGGVTISTYDAIPQTPSMHNIIDIDSEEPGERTCSCIIL